MNQSRTLTSCEQFEQLRFTPDDQLTDVDIQFMFEHIDSCPLGIHTKEAIERYMRMAPETIWSMFSDDPVIADEPSTTKAEWPSIQITPRILQLNAQKESLPLSRRSVLSELIGAAVIWPISGWAADVEKEPRENEWISQQVFNEFNDHYGNSQLPKDRQEMLIELLKPAGVTKYFPARDHPHLPHAGPEGYLRDRLALEAFMLLEDHLPDRTCEEAEELEISSGENAVLSGSPRSNVASRLFLPFQDLTSPDASLISETYREELIPYHFIIEPGRVRSQTFFRGRWQQVVEPSLAIDPIDRRGTLWRPRNSVDAQGQLRTDFLLVSRLPHRHGGDVIILSGGHGAGTEAFRLIFDETAFPRKELLRLFGLLEGHRYFQFVLECQDVTNGADGSHAQRLAISEDCPPIVLRQLTDLFKKT